MICYLDNSATTRPTEAVADAMRQCMLEGFYNPSALYAPAVDSEKRLTACREAIARELHADPARVVFTSGGTEADNWAVMGAVKRLGKRGRHIVTTAVEHSSVRASCDRLEQEGYTVTRLIPAADGTITARQIVDACRPDTALVAVMLVNNETGARFPLEQAVADIRRIAPAAHIHCDAVQAAGKLPLKGERWGFDSMTVSAHKLHGPKGCGALYLRRGVRVQPRNLGGKQENGVRCGTEATPLIAAFGVAAELVPSFAEQRAHFQALRTRLLEQLEGQAGIRFHLPADGVPYIVHLSVPGIRSETLLHYLAQREIYVSSGSACSKGAASPVLTAMGLPPEEIDSALRVSLDHTNTAEDIDRFCQAVLQATGELVRRA